MLSWCSALQRACPVISMDKQILYNLAVPKTVEPQGEEAGEGDPKGREVPPQGSLSA